jgi:hypothetical protein
MELLKNITSVIKEKNMPKPKLYSHSLDRQTQFANKNNIGNNKLENFTNINMSSSNSSANPAQSAAASVLSAANAGVVPAVVPSSVSTAPIMTPSVAAAPTTPAAVLPNNNVQLNNGQIVNGPDVHAASVQSNSTATPVQQLPTGNVLMSNGNSVNPSQSQAAALPVAVVSSNVVMSNGNTVAPATIATTPSAPPNPAGNTSMSANSGHPHKQQASRLHGMMHNMNSSGGCSITTNQYRTKYCTPAPFHSNNGERRFYVNEAYGKPSFVKN